jgi:hypothetical protein
LVSHTREVSSRLSVSTHGTQCCHGLTLLRFRFASCDSCCYMMLHVIVPARRMFRFPLFPTSVSASLAPLACEGEDATTYCSEVCTISLFVGVVASSDDYTILPFRHKIGIPRPLFLSPTHLSCRASCLASATPDHCNRRAACCSAPHHLHPHGEIHARY